MNKQLSDGDLLCLADPRDKDKIFAKVQLCYPHVHDSLVPDSLEGPLEKSLDRTASIDDLIGALEANKEMTEYEKRTIEKLKLTKQKVQELGCSKREAIDMFGF